MEAAKFEEQLSFGCLHSSKKVSCQGVVPEAGVTYVRVHLPQAQAATAPAGCSLYGI